MSLDTCAACEGSGEMHGSFACDMCGGTGKVPAPLFTAEERRGPAAEDKEAIAAGARAYELEMARQISEMTNHDQKIDRHACIAAAVRAIEKVRG